MNNRVINKNLLTLYSLALFFILLYSTGYVSATKGDNKAKSGDKVLKESSPDAKDNKTESMFGGPADTSNRTDFLLPSGVTDEKIRCSLCKKGDKECEQKMKTEGAKPKSKEDIEKDEKEREKQKEKEKEKEKELEELAAKEKKKGKGKDKDEGGGEVYTKTSGYEFTPKPQVYEEKKHHGKGKDHKGDKDKSLKQAKPDKKHGKSKGDKED